MIGYKAILVPNEFKWQIIRVNIPDDAQVVKLSYSAFRTNKVIPEAFLGVKIINGEAQQGSPSGFSNGRSWFNNGFTYTLNKVSESDINPNAHEDCSNGIYFYEKFHDAVCWALTHLGEHYI